MKAERLILLAVAALMLCGCKGRRVVAPEVDGDIKLVPMAELAADTAAAGGWADVYLPFSLTAEAQGEMSVSGRALMLRGEAIFLSFRMMGIEGATMLINNDSVYFVDKYHKLCLAESSQALLGRYDLSVCDIQSLLFGLPFAPAESMRPISWGQLDAGGLLSAAAFDMPGMASAECFYFNPEATPHGAMASLIDFMLWPEDAGDDAQPWLRAAVEWGLGDAKWDTGRQIKFSLPSGYGEIGIESLAAFLRQ